VPIGIRSHNGTITLPPHPSTPLAKGDRLIVIAEDNDTYKPEPPEEIEEGTPPEIEDMPRQPELIFVGGWRRDIRDIFSYLDNLVVKGSELHMMTHCVTLEERNERLAEEGLDVSSLNNLNIVHHFGNTSVRRKLASLPLESYTSCMIFADQAFELDTMHADSHSLATLLLIRDMQYQRAAGRVSVGGDPQDSISSCPIVCEILDPRTQKTISGNRDMQHSSEFCHSNLFIAQIMAMVSENRTVKQLLDEMLGSVGCSVTVFSATRFARPREVASFWTLAKRASRTGAVLLGFNVKGSINPPQLNPRDKRALMQWDGYDLVALVPGLRTLRPEEDSTETPPPLSTEEVRQTKSPREVRREIREEPAEDSLEAKVLRLLEAIASADVDEAERRRLCALLDRLKDVVEALPAQDLGRVRRRVLEDRPSDGRRGWLGHEVLVGCYRN